MAIALNISILLAAFICMEAVAWLAHKYVMHGFLWYLHKDHHQKQPESVLEKNDFFFLIFSIPGIIFLLLGVMNNINYFFWIGAGISVYGLAYFFVHDVFIHQRLKFLKKTDSAYLRAIRKAHKMHHKHLNKHSGECFGMLWVPIKYFKEAQKAKAAK